jgi:hypothetical protein
MAVGGFKMDVESGDVSAQSIPLYKTGRHVTAIVSAIKGGTGLHPIHLLRHPGGDSGSLPG